MQSLRTALLRHFFRPEPAASLSLFRCLYCCWLIVRLTADRKGHFQLFHKSTWYPIPLFEQFGIGLMDLETFRVLHGLLVLALALTAVGAWTRLSAHSAWIVYFVYFGTILGFFKSPDSNYVYHSKNIVVFVLFILAVAPGVAHWGFDGFRRRGSTWSSAPADTPIPRTAQRSAPCGNRTDRRTTNMVVAFHGINHTPFCSRVPEPGAPLPCPSKNRRRPELQFDR